MNLTKILAALLLILAVALGIGAWMLSRQPARQVAAPVASSSAPAMPAAAYAVVVAAKAVPAGQRITADDVKLVQMPAAVTNSFPTVEPLLGRTTVIALVPDSPIFEQHLLSGLALQIEPGQRAVSIAVKEPMAAGHHVRPGDFVDVFFTLDGKTEMAAIDTQTRMLLARSRVLAYGAASVENPPLTAAQRQAQQESDNSNSRRGSGSRDGVNAVPGNANTAVLSVPLEDVERLTLAEKYGQLTLALRHPDDNTAPNPALFTSLPTVLQPVSTRLKKDEVLQPADRAFAGLRFKDLAAGAKAAAQRPTTTPAVNAQAGGSPSTQSASTRPARVQSVEMYQGGTLQTVSY